MLHAGSYRGLKQGMRLDRVGHVVAERIDDGVRNNDLGGEVQDRADMVLPDQPRYQLRIADVTDVKANAGRNGLSRSGRQIVQHDRRFAAIEKGEDCMAANETGASRDQYRHSTTPFVGSAGVPPDLRRRPSATAPKDTPLFRTAPADHAWWFLRPFPVVSALSQCCQKPFLIKCPPWML